MLYGVLASLAGIFFFFVLPETKGKTLEEIDLELRLNRCSVDLLINKKIFFKEECNVPLCELMCLSPSSGFTTKKNVAVS